MDVSFVEFVQLYVNHRPAHGVSHKQVESAFKVLVHKDGDPLMETINRDEFVVAVCERGEPIEEQNVHKCLCALMGEEATYDLEDTNFSFLPEVSLKLAFRCNYFNCFEANQF